MFDFNKIIEYRKQYQPIMGDYDGLVEAIKNNKYEYDYAIITKSILYKNKDLIFNDYYTDMIIQITSPFLYTSINFFLIHIIKEPPKKILTGIFKGKVYENYKNSIVKKSDFKFVEGENITEDFNNLLLDISLFLNKEFVNRDDLNIVDYPQFDIENINPMYYTKQAIKIRKELKESDYALLSDLADIVVKATDKNVTAKCINSKNFVYPIIYDEIINTEIKNAIKVKKGDIICLLIGEKPKFYLYVDDYKDIYIKQGNYCVIRPKDKKYTSYLVNYLNDEKAITYFLSINRGSYILHINTKDLSDLKVIIPTEDMLRISELTQSYLIDRNSISPEEVNLIIRKSTKEISGTEPQKMISEDMINLISNLKTQVIKELISSDLNEVDICFKNGAYKSAIILCGSILEAILLDWLSEYENSDDILQVAKNKNGKDLGLAFLIERLKEIIKPYWYESRKAHEIRETRNLVHPKECIKNNKKISFDECECIIKDLKDILESKQERCS